MKKGLFGILTLMILILLAGCLLFAMPAMGEEDPAVRLTIQAVNSDGKGIMDELGSNYYVYARFNRSDESPYSGHGEFYSFYGPLTEIPEDGCSIVFGDFINHMAEIVNDHYRAENSETGYSGDEDLTFGIIWVPDGYSFEYDIWRIDRSCTIYPDGSAIEYRTVRVEKSSETTGTLTLQLADHHFTTVEFYNQSSTVVPADAAAGTQKHVEGSLEDAALSGTHYMLAVIREKSAADGAIAGWMIKPVELNGKKTETACFWAFYPYGEDGSVRDDGKLITYDADLYTIGTELYHSDSKTWADSVPVYKDLIARGLPGAGDGYAFCADVEGGEYREENTLQFVKTVVSVGLRASKSVEGTAFDGKDSQGRDVVYTLVLEQETGNDTDGYVWPDISERAKSVGDGETAVFGDLVFSKAGTYRFNITEAQVREEDRIPGMTYSGQKIIAEVTVKAVTDGFSAEVAYQGGDGDSGNVITNTYALGGLSLEKQISGNAADKDAKFHFTIQLSGEGAGTVNTTAFKEGEIAFENGAAELDIGTGEVYTAQGIPAGLTYTITETMANKDGYKTVITAENGKIDNKKGVVTGTVTATPDGTCADENKVVYANTKNEYGSLTVYKVTAGNAADQNTEFEFTVQLSGEGYDKIYGDYGEMYFRGGKAAFTLKNGESKTAENLPYGMGYTVTEDDADQDGYVTSYFGNTGKIDSKKVAECVVTNTRNLYGGLVIEKKTAGNDGDRKTWFAVQITLSGPGAEDINGVFGDVEFRNGVSVGPAAGRSSDADYTRTRANEAGEIVRLIPDGYVKVFTYQSLIIRGLPGGIGYTVVEDDYSDIYDSVSYEGGTGTVNGYKTADAVSAISASDAEINRTVITNTRNRTGKLTLRKTVDGTPADADRDYTVTVSVQNADGTALEGTCGQYAFVGGKTSVTLKNGGEAVIDGLPLRASFTVTEEDLTGEGYEAAAYEITYTRRDPESASSATEVTVTSSTGVVEMEQTVTVTNRTALGSLRITKQVTLNGKATSGREADGVYTFTVTGPNGYSKEVSITVENGVMGETAVDLLVPGTYTVTEKEPQDDSIRLVGENGVTVEVTKNNASGVKTAAFVNDKTMVGSLAVSKTVQGNAVTEEDLAQPFSVTLSLTDKDGGKLSGSYSAVRRAADGTESAETVTAADGSAPLTLKASETLTVSGLPDGTVYALKENADDKWVVKPENSSGTIAADAVAEAAFVNTYDILVGALRVTKSVEGDGADPTRTYPVQISLTGPEGSPLPDGTYGGAVLANGDGRVQVDLKAGEAVTLSDLPLGTSFTVEETAQALEELEKLGYTGVSYILSYTESSGAAHTEQNVNTGTVAIEQRNVEVVNTIALGSLRITKSVTVNGASAEGSTEADGTYTFTVKAPDGGETVHSLTVVNGRKAEKLVTSLVPGTYTVTETAPTNGTVPTGDSVTVEVKAGSEVEAAFVNNLEVLGSLSVTKKVNKVIRSAADADTVFRFEIELGDDSIEGTYGAMTFAAGKAEVSLKANQTAAAEGLPAGTAYTVKEIGIPDGYVLSGSAVQSGVIEKDRTAQAQFVNAYDAGGEFTVTGTKVLKGKELTEGQFTFVLKSTAGETVATAVNKADGSFAFEPISFTLADLTLDSNGVPETRYYTVSEVIPEGAVDAKKDGIVYPVDARTVQVSFTDNGNGVISAEVSGTDGEIVFTNTYQAENSLSIRGRKLLDGRSVKNGEFAFILKDEAGNQVEEVTNDGTEFTFSPIKFTKAGEYTYTVSEKDTSVGGIEYDETVYSVVIRARDNGTGSLDFTTVYQVGEDPADEIVFRNTYHAYGAAELTGTKKMVGRTLEGGVFTFTVKEGDAVVSTGTAAADGSIVFSKITYALSDVGRHTYSVSEDGVDAAGYVMDEEVRTVIVDVQDNADGTLQTVVTGDGEDLVFTNSYKAEASILLEGRKTFENEDEARRFLGGGSLPVFSFTLAEVIDGSEEIAATVRSSAEDGSILFGSLTYTQADAGTHTYVIREVDEGSALAAYDDAEYTVTVKVTDNGDGTLTTEKEITKDGEAADEIVFTNAVNHTYLTLQKTVTGETTDYAFRLTVILKLNGEELTDSYEYYGSKEGTIKSGGTIEIRSGDNITIKDLPEGVYYRVVEEECPRYRVIVNGQDTMTAEGTACGEEGALLEFTNSLISTTFTVYKQWVGVQGGKIRLIVYADGVELVPQPTVNWSGNSNTYTVDGLPKYTYGGRRIIYTAKEAYMSGYMTDYRNLEGLKADCAYDGCTIVNTAVKQMRVRSSWSGVGTNEALPSVGLTVYRANGNEYKHVDVSADKNGWLNVYNLPLGSEYYVVADPIDGFKITYANDEAGKYATDTDKTWENGTINLHKIAKTGDDRPVELWLGLIIASVVGMMVLAFGRKRVRKY